MSFWRSGLALLDENRVARALAKTGAKAVAIRFAYQSRLALDDLDGPFGTGFNAQATPIAFLFIDCDDFPAFWHG